MSKINIGEEIKSEFVSDDNRHYRFHIGRHNASALSGFIAGAVLATIIWFAVAFFMIFLNR